MGSIEITKSVGYFVLAGLFEIGGGYLIWLWIREGKPVLYALIGAVILVLYGVVPTLQPATGVCTGERAVTVRSKVYRESCPPYWSICRNLITARTPSTTFSIFDMGVISLFWGWRVILPSSQSIPYIKDEVLLTGN